MQPIRDEETLREAIARVKARAATFQTNYYATPEQTRHWIAEGRLFAVEQADAVLILRRDGEFDRVYHAAPDPRTLATALQSLNGGRALVSDIIGRPAELPEVTAAYEQAGFKRYQELIRMALWARFPACGGGLARPGPSVRVAQDPELPAAHAFLRRMLDPYADQPPTVENLRRAAVLVSGPAATPDGVLVFETIGLSSTLRYWYVEPGVRNRGTGGRLMRRMLYECRDSRRILLWVRSDNNDAIGKYEHYGFRTDGLADHILMRRTSWQTNRRSPTF